MLFPIEVSAYGTAIIPVVVARRAAVRFRTVARRRSVSAAFHRRAKGGKGDDRS
jgi:hypothetical protein